MTPPPEEKNAPVPSSAPDLVRSVAAYLVIVVHALIPAFQKTPPDWATGIAWMVLAKTCVPLFFMLSGALLLGKQESPWVFYRKRAAKLLLPFLAWSFLYLAVRRWGKHEEGLSFLPSEWLLHPAYFHLWFLHAIACLYLAMPLFRWLHGKLSPSGTLVLIVLWFLGVSVAPTACTIFGHPLPWDDHPLQWMAYAGYLFLGHRLFHARTLRPWFPWLLATATFGVGTTLTLVRSRAAGHLDSLFLDYLNPVTVLLAGSLLLALKQLGDRIPSATPLRMLPRIGAASLGIYLVHPLVLHFVHAAGLRWDTGTPVLGIPLTAAAAFLGSWLLVAMLGRIPLLRKTV